MSVGTLYFDSFGREGLTASDYMTAKFVTLNPFSETILSLRGPRSDRDESVCDMVRSRG